MLAQPGDPERLLVARDDGEEDARRPGDWSWSATIQVDWSCRGSVRSNETLIEEFG